MKLNTLECYNKTFELDNVYILNNKANTFLNAGDLEGRLKSNLLLIIFLQIVNYFVLEKLCFRSFWSI